MHKHTLLPLVAAAALALTGCATEPLEGELAETTGNPEPFDRAISPTATEGDATPTPGERQTTVHGFIRAQEQTSDGRTVQVDVAEVSGVDGWVVLHANDDGSPGAVLGTYALTSDLETKRETDFEIELGEPLETGEQTVWLMLHRDDGQVGTYEFPGPDEPIVVDGEVVQIQVRVIVQ